MSLEQSDHINLRVGSYNIGSGDLHVGHNMELIARDILSRQLDIVGLQEVDRVAWRTGYADMPQLLSEYTGYPYYYYSKCVSLHGRPNANGEYGDCVLSKYPIQSAEHTILEHGRREARSLSCVQVDVNGTMINFHNTHLEHGRKDQNQELRLIQLAQIADLLRDESCCILTGDFNCSPEDQYGALSFLTGVCKTTGEPFTHPRSASTIDNILFSGDIQLVSADVLYSGASDHSLLYAEFKIKK